jgi:hypothetical protein
MPTLSHENRIIKPRPSTVVNARQAAKSPRAVLLLERDRAWRGPVVRSRHGVKKTADVIAATHGRPALDLR